MIYVAGCDRFFGDAPGGAYRIAWELTRQAARQGHRAYLVCGSVDTDPPEGIETREGVQLVRFRFPRLAPWNPFRWKALLQAVSRALRTYLGDVTADVVHGHTLAPALALFTWAPAQARRIYSAHSPVILEQRINWRAAGLTGFLKLATAQPVLRRSEEAALRSATMVHTLSRYTAEELARFHGDNFRERLKVLPWWVEPSSSPRSRTEARRALGWPLDGPLILSVRRLVPRMGLDVLVEALGRLGSERPYHAVIAGEGPERDRLVRQAKSLGLADRLRFAGRLSEEQLADAYAAADLTVIPTRSLECFGLTALESLAQGVPVAASRVGALPEVLEPALSPLLFEAGDADGLAVVLRDVLSGARKLPPPERLKAFALDQFAQAKLLPSYRLLLFGADRSPDHAPGH